MLFFRPRRPAKTPIHPRVAEDTLRRRRNHDEAVHPPGRFLEGIGVREVGEFQQVEAILKRRYGTDSHPASHPWEDP